MSSSSSLASFSISSFASMASTSSASVGSFSAINERPLENVKMIERWDKVPPEVVGIIFSYDPQRAKLFSKVRIFKNLMQHSYSKALAAFHLKIGAQKYKSIVICAANKLKNCPKGGFKEQEIKSSLLAKKIFCDFFKKIRIMKGDGFLRMLFREEFLSISDINKSNAINEVIDQSMSLGILEKMYVWLEDQNLIKMMGCLAQSCQELSALKDQVVFKSFDSSSLEMVHAKADEIRKWMEDNNAQLLLVSEMFLSGIGLTYLPEEIGMFANLDVLQLENNRLSTLPESIGNLSELVLLHLKDNQLIFLPDSVEKLNKLITLVLMSNKLRTLPKNIGKMGKLLHFYATSNQLTTLPNSIRKWKNLQHLILSNNQLRSLPDIGDLKHLQKLCLFNNQLTDLPIGINKLVNLDTLEIDARLLSRISWNNLSPHIEKLLTDEHGSFYCLMERIFGCFFS